MLLYPFAEDSHAGRALFSVLGIAILGLVVLNVRRSPAFTWVSVLLGIPATVLLLIQAVTGSDDLLPYSSAFEAVLYFYAAGAMIAYTYTVCQAIEPHSFTAAVDPTAERSWMELLFLSFTTLTSTGLSDVAPVALEPLASRSRR